MIRGCKEYFFTIDEISFSDYLTVVFSFCLLSAIGFDDLNSWEFFSDSRGYFCLYILMLSDKHFTAFAVLKGKKRIDRDDESDHKGEIKADCKEDDDVGYANEDVPNKEGEIIADGWFGLIDIWAESADQLSWLIQFKEV